MKKFLLTLSTICIVAILGAQVGLYRNWLMATFVTGTWEPTGTALDYTGTKPVTINGSTPYLTINRSSGTLGSLIQLQQSGVEKAWIGVSGSSNNIVTGSVSGDLGMRTGGNILFSTDSGTTAHMYIKNGGSVGIGTTSPNAAAKLDVNGQLYISGGSPYLVVNRTSGTSGSLIQFQQSGVEKAWIGAAGDANNIVNGAVSGDLGMRTGGNILFSTNSGTTAHMYIKNGGNVGIGTTTPGELLSLGAAGTTKGVLSLAGDTSGKVIIQPAAAAGSYTLTLPNTAGNADEFLKTDGLGGLTWAAGGGAPGGNTTEIQYNNAGVFGASSNFSYDSTNNLFKVGFGGAANLEIDGTANTIKMGDIGGTANNSQILIDDANQYLAINTGTLFMGNIGAGTNYMMVNDAAGSVEISGISLASIGDVNGQGNGLRFVVDSGNEVAYLTDIDEASNFNFGIGTTVPGELLSLGLEGTTKGVLSLAGDTSGKVVIQPATAAGSYTLTLPDTDGNTDEFLKTDGSGNLSWEVFQGWSLNGQAITAKKTLGSTDNFDVGFITNNTERLTIKNTGNVGIATTSPTGKFQVNSVDIPSISGTSATGALVINANGTASMTMGVDTTAYFDGWIQMRNSALSGYTYPLALQPLGGFVGIGTANPSAGLHLVGNVPEKAGIRLTETYVGRTWQIGAGVYGALHNGFSIYDVTSSKARVFVDDTGYVGIGTTTPASLLSLYKNTGAGTNTELAIFETTNDNAYIGIGRSASYKLELGFKMDSNYSWLQSYTTNKTTYGALALNPTGGNVVVGTGIATPFAKFDVEDANQSATSGTGNLFIGTTDALAADKGGMLGLGGKATSGGATSIFAGIVGRKENATSGNYQGYLGFYTGTAGGAMAERMRIDSAGNVGIGTTSPTARLSIQAISDVYGESISGNTGTGHSYGLKIIAGTNSTDTAFNIADVTNVKSYLRVRGDGQVSINDLQNNTLNDYGLIIRGRNLASNSYGLKIIAGTNSTDTAFNVADVTNTNGYLVVKGDGNVGIGVSSPAEKLDIAGAMHLAPQASPPTSADAGDLYVDSTPTPNELCFYDGSSWQAIASGTDSNCQ